jgi:Uma2 family endonuclease
MRLKEKETFITPEEYLAEERSSSEKHEYLDGEVFLMAGGTKQHAELCWRLSGILYRLISNSKCRAFSSDLKVRTSNKGLYSYPDLTVVCGEQRFEDGEEDVLLNPKAIFEVLSPSTEAYDRGEKFFRYQQIESLTDYILVSQEKVHIDHLTRQTDGWLHRSYSAIESELLISSIQSTISLAEVYQGIVD